VWWCRSVTIIIDSHACTPNHQAPPAMHRIACHVVGAQGREIPWAQPQQLQAIPAGPSKHTDIWHYDSGQPIPGTPHLAALPPSFICSSPLAKEPRDRFLLLCLGFGLRAGGCGGAARSWPALAREPPGGAALAVAAPPGPPPLRWRWLAP